MGGVVGGAVGEGLRSVLEIGVKTNFGAALYGNLKNTRL